MQRKKKEKNCVYWQLISFLDENRFAKGGYSILSKDIEIFPGQKGYLSLVITKG